MCVMQIGKPGFKVTWNKKIEQNIIEKRRNMSIHYILLLLKKIHFFVVYISFSWKLVILEYSFYVTNIYDIAKSTIIFGLLVLKPIK